MAPRPARLRVRLHGADGGSRDFVARRLPRRHARLVRLRCRARGRRRRRATGRRAVVSSDARSTSPACRARAIGRWRTARPISAALDVDTNDLAQLLLAEFMLLFSNDWCLLPLELARRQVHAHRRSSRHRRVRRSDARARGRPRRATAIGSAGRCSASTATTPRAMGLLLAPALTAALASPAVEQVHFLRDEMANMVWAVEHRVASKPRRAARSRARRGGAGSRADAARRAIRLGTTVPANWRPFVPAHVPGLDAQHPVAARADAEPAGAAAGDGT